MRNKLVGSIICVLILTSTNIASAESGWDDDFDDGDLKGWDVATYWSTDLENIGATKGEVLITNDNYRLLVQNPVNETHHGANWAERNSTQAYGHWTLDVNTTAGSSCGIIFICRDLTPEADLTGLTYQSPLNVEGYVLSIYTEEIWRHQFMLWKMDAKYTVMTGIQGYNLLDSIKFGEMGLSPYGVFDIDITRTQAGNITVWVKPTIDTVFTKALSAIDNTYTKSERFAIYSQFSWPLSRFDIYFDNIRVDNDPSWEPDDWKLPPPKSCDLADLIGLALIPFTGVVIVVFVWWFLKKGRKD